MINKDDAAVTGLSLEDLVRSSDGLSRSAELFAEISGRELTGEQLEIMVFLSQNGSPDLVERLMGWKRYQTRARDIRELIEVLSPATHAQDMMERQANVQRRGE